MSIYEFILAAVILAGVAALAGEIGYARGLDRAVAACQIGEARP